MKYVDPSVKLIDLPLLEKIELAGRVCYKSEDKIKETADLNFINGICKRGHTSVLEHGGIYFSMEKHCAMDLLRCIAHIDHSKREDLVPYIKYTVLEDKRRVFFSTNLRLLHNYSKLNDNPWVNTFFKEFIVSFPELAPFITIGPSLITIDPYMSIKRDQDMQEDLMIETFNIICDRAIQNELVRHRTMSFSVESTRYCNYSKDKFGTEISIITPETMVLDSLSYCAYHTGCAEAEQDYFNLLDLGNSPQIARKILPLGLKTEFFMSGHVYNWNKVFKLRSVAGAHPEVRVLSMEMNKILNKKYGDDIVPLI